MHENGYKGVIFIIFIFLFSGFIWNRAGIEVDRIRDKRAMETIANIEASTGLLQTEYNQLIDQIERIQEESGAIAGELDGLSKQISDSIGIIKELRKTDNSIDKTIKRIEEHNRTIHQAIEQIKKKQDQGYDN